MTLIDRAAEHRAQAVAALSAKNWSVAERELVSYLTIKPDDPIAWNNFGVALEHQHKERDAVEAYARASALMPTAAVPGTNLIRGMQRYLGFAAALVLFRVIDIVLHLVPMSEDMRTGLLLGALLLLAVGALVFYQRRRETLPEETWHAYKSEMDRTRKLRYGGLAFVFIGFLVFAMLLFVLLLGSGGVNDGLVVLVILGGLCWLIVARLIWRSLVGPFLEARID